MTEIFIVESSWMFIDGCIKYSLWYIEGCTNKVHNLSIESEEEGQTWREWNEDAQGNKKDVHVS